MNSLVQSAVVLTRSSIGKKLLVAATGIVLMAFLVGHLLGNLLIYQGPDALNAYAKFLHSKPILLWVARAVLLACLIIHVWLTIQLARENRAARPSAYGSRATRRASVASRTMFWSGLIIFNFVVYHLLHFTVGAANGYYDTSSTRYYLPNGDHNVYNMIIDGFRWPPASLFYILSMALLCLHLSHGFSSVFQTLGLTTPNTRKPIDIAGKVFAAFIFLGNISIPLTILLGIKK